jgi:LytS/YehU family sensor histidine kinase
VPPSLFLVFNFCMPILTQIFNLRVKAANSYRVLAEKSIILFITPPWSTKLWFRIGLIVCVAALFYALIRRRLHQKFRLQLERSEKEKQFAELQHKTAELEIKALRAQMNPHFIFNSLNSINMFILENNKQEASDYLSKFSKLVRMILQHSQEAFISLDRELEALRLYLELESLRFGERFEYKISVSEVDSTMVKIPPLIIQPYAENAIWHGLMHLPGRSQGTPSEQAGKKEKGHLEIELYIKDKILFCKITDDGIGRKKAAELRSKSSLTKKSMGMRITADRVAILQKEQNENSISVNDLVYPDGSAAGTEVLIKMPAHYD